MLNLLLRKNKCCTYMWYITIQSQGNSLATSYQDGRSQKFLQEGATSKSCLSYSDCWQWNSVDVHKRFHPFYTTKIMPYIATTVKKYTSLATKSRKMTIVYTTGYL